MPQSGKEKGNGAVRMAAWGGIGEEEEERSQEEKGVGGGKRGRQAGGQTNLLAVVFACVRSPPHKHTHTRSNSN